MKWQDRVHDMEVLIKNNNTELIMQLLRKVIIPQDHMHRSRFHKTFLSFTSAAAVKTGNIDVVRGYIKSIGWGLNSDTYNVINSIGYSAVNQRNLPMLKGSCWIRLYR